MADVQVQEEETAPVRTHAPGCNQSYARIEHLERHIKTHTDPAGYTCKECGKSFARSDVLRRHTKIHSREATAPGEGGGTAKRVSQACQSCATAKPCERCNKLKRSCEYDTGQSSASSTREPKRARMQSQSVELENPTFDLQVDANPNQGDPNVESPAAAGSNTILDSLLSLVLQQQPAGTTTLEDDLSNAFFLPTDDNMFWSQFLQSPSASLPSPVHLEPAPPSVQHDEAASPPPSSTPSYRPRILITAAGMPSRHGSPHPEVGPAGEEGELDPGTASTGGRSTAADAAAHAAASASSAWPLIWNPTGHESSVRLDREASMSILATPIAPASGAGPSLPKCDEQLRIALLETLRFAQLSDDEYHALYGTLSRIPLPVFDLLLSLYFGHFHPLIPFLHVPTFNPKKTLGQLLLILLGIGAVYAPISGALQLGRVLVEVARRGVERLINRDNRLARSLPIAQAQMLWAVLRWTGSGRTMELAAVFQSVHTTMLRQQRVFEDSQSRMPVDNSPAAQWSAFITNEERRRTAMACYLLDGEAAVLLRTAPCMNGSELKTLLPCDESLWTAPNAEAWLEAKANVRDPVAIPVVLKLLSSDSATPLPAAINLSPFGAHVLVQALHLNLHHVQQLRKSGVSSHADLITTHVRRSLGRLARGTDEFTPRFGANGGLQSQDDPALYAAPRAWYHLGQIATYIPLEELDGVARKAGDGEAQRAREHWVKWMREHSEQARVLALHAGQLLRTLRDFPTHGTYEPATLLYATLVLYLYARSVEKPRSSWKLAATPPHPSSSAAMPAHPPAGPNAFYLDTSLDDPSSFTAFGGTAVITLPSAPGSLELEGDEAARITLRAAVEVLAARPVWRVGRTFIAVLGKMLAREGEAGLGA
ncbi:hypothetical protein Rhopal_001235-T1 [Rhodotorula paludigena]|uniref:C2H2-type domain-containing protein n=1 Tax=Rhodotorula paludigena TaxID=86838 RepID=A0AAV5GEV6_9BASI|nr:hypothetical protein Rhopal_001235-T1 [Rhodotorula paludigena]